MVSDNIDKPLFHLRLIVYYKRKRFARFFTTFRMTEDGVSSERQGGWKSQDVKLIRDGVAGRDGFYPDFTGLEVVFFAL